MPLKRPPGPRDWFFGMPQVKRMKADFLGFTVELREQYGDVVYFKAGPYHQYFFFHPDHIRETLVDHYKNLPKQARTRKIFSQWDGNGLVLSEGDFWLRQRRLVQKAFHPKRFDLYAAQVVGLTQRRVEQWKPAGQSFSTDFAIEVTELAMEIVGQTLFGVALSAALAEQIRQAVACVSEIALNEIKAPFTLPDWLPFPTQRRKRAATKLLDDTIRGFIRDRRASGEDRGDLLSMLLLAVDEEGNQGGMTDEQARDEAMTLFFAGHDTTAAALSWVFARLAQHPDVQAQARAEIDTAIGGRTPEFADVAKLTYLEAMLNETMRIHPPAVGVFTREATVDLKIGGWDVPRGSWVQVYSYPVHRDPRWFADPLQFDPGRFLPGRVETIRPFAYFPFGGGPRGCVGEKFARLEMLLITATILQNYTVALAPNAGPIVPLQHVSLKPRDGLPLVFTKR